MIALVSVLLFTAPPASADEWKLVFQPIRGRELSYAGTVRESSQTQRNVQFEVTRSVSVNCLITEVDAFGRAEVVCNTVRTVAGTSGDRHVTSSFCALKQDERLRWKWATNGADPTLPPDGEASFEIGFLLEKPNPVRMMKGAKWAISRTGQPPVMCELIGLERVAGVPAARIEMLQHSDTWRKTTDPMPAWKNDTTVWVNPETGVVVRVVRIFSQRKRAEPRPSRVQTTVLDLVSDDLYRGESLTHYVDQMREGARIEAEFEGLDPTRTARSKFTAVRQRIDRVVNDIEVTVARESLVRLRERIVAAEKGEKETGPVTSIKAGPLEVGQRARVLVLRDADSGETLNNRRMLGRTHVLVFMSPNSPMGELALTEALSVVRELAGDREDLVTVMAVPLSSAGEDREMLRKRVEGKYTIAAGSGTDKSFGIKSLPHTLVIDPVGVLRGSLTGHGPAYRYEVTDAVRTAVQVKPETASGKKSTIR
jgi:hypothetical protein